MSHLDPKVASVLDNAQEGSEDEDALISALEADDEVSAFRERRLEELHAEVARAKSMSHSDHGSYSEVKDEKTVMDLTTQTKLCVVHFFKPDFGRCAVMDGHLESLAPKHFDTRFLKVNVESAPFLVEKLKIRVLPCVLAFVDGVCVDRVVGFEGLGHGTDDFPTRELEGRLLKSNVLVRQKLTAKDEVNRSGYLRGKRPGQANGEEDDDDWD